MKDYPCSEIQVLLTKHRRDYNSASEASPERLPSGVEETGFKPLFIWFSTSFEFLSVLKSYFCLT